MARRLWWNSHPQRPGDDPEPDWWVQQQRLPVDAGLDRLARSHLEAGVGPLGPVARAAGQPGGLPLCEPGGLAGGLQPCGDDAKDPGVQRRLDPKPSGWLSS
jgi:hypothetical protein